MQADMRRMGKVMARTHPAVDRVLSREEWTQKVAEATEALPESLSQAEYLLRMQELLRALECGHVIVYPKGYILWRIFGKPDQVFPVRLERLDDGGMMIAALAPGIDSQWIGRRLKSIENIPVEELLEGAMVFEGGSDGTNASGAGNRAARNVGSYLNWRYGQIDTFHVLWVGDNGESNPGSLPAFDRKAYKKTASAKTKNARQDSTAAHKPSITRRYRPIHYGFDTLRKVAVVDINSFSGYDPYNLRWPLVLQKVFAKAQADGAKALVLDLRENGGGRASNVRRVLARVLTEESALYDSWSMPRSGLRHASMLNRVLLGPAVIFGKGSQRLFPHVLRHDVRPARKHFEGPVVTLINSSTFSAASITASVLKSTGRAELVGQQAGGNYHQTYAGLFSHVSLRKTGLRLRVPHLYIPVAVDSARQDFKQTLLPDLNVPRDKAMVLHKEDQLLLLALERAAQLAGSEKEASSGSNLRPGAAVKNEEIQKME